MKVLDPSFYLSEDVVFLARELLGKVIVTSFNGQTTSGIISETEAYAGVTDRASHAYGGRYTERTSVMYAEGGTAYVYLCYGIHHLFNVVTNVNGIPHAVLIRNIFPSQGIDEMMKRRGYEVTRRQGDKRLLTGPGTLTQALGINLQHNGTSLMTGPIRIEEHGFTVDSNDIISGPRIGVAYAGEDALLPYRFVLSGK